MPMKSPTLAASSGRSVAKAFGGSPDTWLRMQAAHDRIKVNPLCGAS
jgi:plasmid maintenance system antidote protein VapI